MEKYAPNQITENIIDYYQTPCKIHEDDYISIFLALLIIPTLDGPISEVYPNLSWYHIIHLLRGGYYNMYMLLHSTCDRREQHRGNQLLWLPSALDFSRWPNTWNRWSAKLSDKNGHFLVHTAYIFLSFWTFYKYLHLFKNIRTNSINSLIY